MSEQVEHLDANAEFKQGNIYDIYLLLHALEIGAMDFTQFLDKSLKWAHQVPDTNKQKTTLAKK